MHWTHAVLLGIVEGLTEFLPVSSTGHLILSAKLLHLPQTEVMKSFEIAIQLGAMLAVVWIYWRSFLLEWETLKRVITAFFPTALIGFLLYHLIKKFLFSDASLVLWALAGGGVLLILFDLLYREKENSLQDISRVPFPNAFGIGVIQSLAVIPGVSRSAATIVGGVFFGIGRKKAVEFSFLLAVPTLFAATALDIFKNRSAFAQSDWQMLLLGSVVSFVVAILSIRLFLSMIQKQKKALLFFGVYRILLAVLFWNFVK